MIRLIAVDPADADRLAEVHAAAFETAWSAQELRDQIGGAGVEAIAARRDEGDTLGFILVRVIAGEAEILTLAVRPEARGRGWGLALVEAAIEAATAADAALLWLEVAADNEPALRLYRRAGFEPVSRRPGYYRRASGPRMDAVVMRRTLNSAPL